MEMLKKAKETIKGIPGVKGALEAAKNRFKRERSKIVSNDTIKSNIFFDKIKYEYIEINRFLKSFEELRGVFLKKVGSKFVPKQLPEFLRSLSEKRMEATKINFRCSLLQKKEGGRLQSSPRTITLGQVGSMLADQKKYSLSMNGSAYEIKSKGGYPIFHFPSDKGEQDLIFSHYLKLVKEQKENKEPGSTVTDIGHKLDELKENYEFRKKLLNSNNIRDLLNNLTEYEKEKQKSGALKKLKSGSESFEFKDIRNSILEYINKGKKLPQIPYVSDLVTFFVEGESERLIDSLLRVDFDMCIGQIDKIKEMNDLEMKTGDAKVYYGKLIIDMNGYDEAKRAFDENTKSWDNRYKKMKDWINNIPSARLREKFYNHYKNKLLEQDPNSSYPF